MTREEVLRVVSQLNRQQRVRWLHALGWAMTVSARAGYPAAQLTESVPHLMAFNELQHQLYNYLRQLETTDQWRIENFLDGIYQKAVSSGVEGDFGWALKVSLEHINR
jgi:hypothetical protein